MALNMVEDIVYLYGGDQPWDASRWVASNDIVRGGSSTSFLVVSESPVASECPATSGCSTSAKYQTTARFYGHLDTETLGGAGFASQRTRGELSLDLRGSDGIIVSIAGPAPADGKRYALTLKDTIDPPRGDGREAAGISWEADFVADKPRDVRLAWRDFKPTYRGRPKHDAKPLDLGSIKRVGLMMRSFFDQQKGDFSLQLHGLATWTPRRELLGLESDGEEEEEDLKLGVQDPSRQARRPWWKVLCCGML